MLIPVFVEPALTEEQTRPVTASACGMERIKSSSKTVAFTWGELEDKTYRNLSPCPNCAPQLRKSGIDELNEKNNR